MPGLKCLTLWCLTNICWVHDMFLSYGQFLGDGHPLVPCYLDKRGFTVLSCSPCTLTEMPFPCLITSQSNISAAIIITIGASATKQMEDYTSRGTINICSCMWFSSLLPELIRENYYSPKVSRHINCELYHAGSNCMYQNLHSQGMATDVPKYKTMHLLCSVWKQTTTSITW